MENKTIKELQKKIEKERRKILSCQHDYDDPFYNPEKVKEPYGCKLVGHGSDLYPEPEGYHDVEKARWTRICKHCGYEQHTKELEPVVTSRKPKF